MKINFLVSTLFLIGTLNLGHSQSQIIIQDTTYLEKKEGKWSEVVKVTYENGEVNLKTKPLGDSLQVISYYVNKHEKMSEEYVENIKRAVISLNTSYNQIGRDNTALQLSNFPPLINIITKSTSFKFEGTWNLRGDDFKINTCEIVKRGPSFSLVTDTGTYPTVIFSDKHIRLIDYPQKGNMVDLFELYENVFIDWTQNFIIFK